MICATDMRKRTISRRAKREFSCANCISFQGLLSRQKFIFRNLTNRRKVRLADISRSRYRRTCKCCRQTFRFTLASVKVVAKKKHFVYIYVGKSRQIEFSWRGGGGRGGWINPKASEILAVRNVFYVISDSSSAEYPPWVLPFSVACMCARWLTYSFLRMRIDVFLLHFEQSNERRTTGREFSASPLLKAGSERIFLAFPLAASVTRLRLKYLLVDFTTMGSCHHRRLSSPAASSSRDFFYRTVYISRARKFISFKNVLRDFSVFRQARSPPSVKLKLKFRGEP